MKQKTNNITTLLMILLLLVGLSLLLYPSISNYWNSFHSSQAISSYAEEVANLDEDQYEKMWSAAWEYNQTLAGRSTNFALSDSQKDTYEKLLNLSNDGLMGYIEIPKLGVSLPIYHGTETAVLQIAAGHLEWSSLPVGGAGSHCVISGHRGLPSAKLFTDLDKLQEEDIFMLRVLDEILTYEVDKISIVEPSQVSDLQIVEGSDLCTLVTCTPYGINTHRLLVRGHRIENVRESKAIRVTSDALQIDPLIVAPVVAAPILLLLLVILLLPKRQKPSYEGNDADSIPDDVPSQKSSEKEGKRR